MPIYFKRPNYYLILFFDLILLAAAYVGANLIRFEWSIPADFFNKLPIFVFVIFCKLVIFHFFGLYQGMWRYTGMVDILNIVKAAVLSTLVLMTSMLLLQDFKGFSRSVFLLDGLLTLFFIGGSRIAIRLYFSSSLITGTLPFQARNGEEFKRVLVVGAGDAGEKVLREILDNPRHKTKVIGFVDDSPKKQGQMIHGVRILGSIKDLSQVAKKEKLDEILIALPSANGQEMRKVVEICKATKLPFKTLPGLGEVIDGRVSLKTIRDVSYGDLLRRPEVSIETRHVSEYLSGKTVLVTGAGGSIGSELCRQICRFNPVNMILLDAVEQNLFHLEMELKQEYEYLKFKIVLGNILNLNLIRKIFQEYRPHVVFHAAAYKHVPLVELNPWEGVLNNLIGTSNIIDASVEHEVERFILVSTDKAVRPSNVMGATKRIAELLVQSQDHSKTRCLAVRFGNVVGSSGSVIPLFRKQIEKGGPVTVTHPEMCRYFMTIPEAAQLILQAASMGHGGEIFILDMGTPIKVVDLAKDLIRLSGFEPDRDIEIKFIGSRPGEKLYEELITEGEGIIRTEHNHILVLNGSEVPKKKLGKQINELLDLAEKFDAKAIRNKLHEILPEYTYHENKTAL
ncbi:MAG: polysaccharide biosynthesis protein [Deltaproteobacteria bacterium]|nr:polysaccharide biosynthesis protein [Deltaproteobacteria bacterium]